MSLLALHPEARGAEIIAHRGSSHAYPENTRASADAAWQEGADALEIDVRLTRDGRIVLMHDESVKRTAGQDRTVAEMTYAEMQKLDAGSWKGPDHSGEPVPLLDDILEAIPSGRKLYVEIKCGVEVVTPLRTLCERSKVASRQLLFISFDPAVCAAIKQALPAHSVLWIVGTYREAPPLALLIAACQLSGLNGLDLRADWPIDSRFVQTVRAAGLALCVWTVDDPALASRLDQAGVDGITTNRPGWLRAELAKTGGR